MSAYQEQLAQIKASYQTIFEKFSTSPWAQRRLAYPHPDQWKEDLHYQDAMRNYAQALIRAENLINNNATPKIQEESIVALKSTQKLSFYVLNLILLNAHDAFFTQTIKTPKRSDEEKAQAKNIISLRISLMSMLTNSDAIETAYIQRSKISGHFYKVWMKKLSQNWPVLKFTKNLSETQLRATLTSLQSQFQKLSDALYRAIRINQSDRSPVDAQFFKYHASFISLCDQHHISSALFEEEINLAPLENSIALLQSLKESIDSAVKAFSLSRYKSKVDRAWVECVRALEAQKSTIANKPVVPISSTPVDLISITDSSIATEASLLYTTPISPDSEQSGAYRRSRYSRRAHTLSPSSSDNPEMGASLTEISPGSSFVSILDASERSDDDRSPQHKRSIIKNRLFQHVKNAQMRSPETRVLSSPSLRFE